MPLHTCVEYMALLTTLSFDLYVLRTGNERGQKSMNVNSMTSENILCGKVKTEVHGGQSSLLRN